MMKRKHDNTEYARLMIESLWKIEKQIFKMEFPTLSQMSHLSNCNNRLTLVRHLLIQLNLLLCPIRRDLNKNVDFRIARTSLQIPTFFK
jgi:hypothetical protein